MNWFSHFDADWRKKHVAAHVLGGVVRVACISLIVWLFMSGRIALAVLATVTYQQGEWERFQREYDPTYPVWSMVGDTVITVVGALAALGALALLTK